MRPVPVRAERSRSALCVLVLAAAVATGCVEPTDDPSTVHDLRVLGVQTEPSELLTESCDPEDPAALLTFASSVSVRALVLDPQGQGRPIEYELLGCVRPGDRTCSEPGERVSLATGTTTGGLLELALRPGLAMIDEDTPLLQWVLEADPYQGLGGVRMPLVLRVRAGDEEVYAQKLMVFGCRLFPEMQPNVTPVLPGVQLAGAAWPDTEVPTVEGPGPFVLTPVDFSDSQEPYIVPSFELEPVHLEERWQLAWYASAGTISPNQTGGSDFGGGEGRHRVEWQPPIGDGAIEQDVTFWIVARDGRGGVSWLSRTAHHVP